MPTGQRPDWIVNTVVTMEGGKNRWREIGVGFAGADGETLTVLLDALPVGGRLVLTRPKQRSQGEAQTP